MGAVDRRVGRVRAELLALDRDEVASGYEDADLVAVEQHVDNGVLVDVVLVHKDEAHRAVEVVRLLAHDLRAE